MFCQKLGSPVVRCACFLPACNRAETNHPSDGKSSGCWEAGLDSVCCHGAKGWLRLHWKAAARKRSLLRQVGSSEGVKWQMTDGGHVAQGASYFELRSCSKAFREINIFLFLMTAIYYIVLPLFVFFFFFNRKHPPNLSICAQASSLKAGDEDEHHLCFHCPSQADWVMMMFFLALYLYNLWQQ